MKKIIITGGTGFIGRKVVALLAKKHKKQELILLVRNKNNKLEQSGRKIIQELGLKTHFVDLSTGYGLGKVPKNPDIIIHLAANTNTSDPNHRVNNLGTKNLINSLAPLKSQTHIIYTSTTAVMAGRKDSSRPFSEADVPYSSNEYGRTKLNAEINLQKVAKKSDCYLTILRLPTVWGKNMREDSFFNFLKNYISKNSLITRLNWPGLTGFVHVDDVAKIIMHFTKKLPSSKVSIYTLQAEALNLQQIFRMAYRFYKIKYVSINIPNSIWRLLKEFRKHIQRFETLLPAKYYNYLWRLSIIVDNVIYANPQKIKKEVHAWRPKHLKYHLYEVF